MQDVADVREDDGSTTDRFLSRMRAALSDLPPTEVTELLEDTEEHVRELAREHGEDQLELRLGSPEAYAAELRSAAGYPPPPQPEEPTRELPKDPRKDGVEALALAGLIVTTASALLFGASIRSYHTTPLFLLTGLVGLAISLPLLVRGQDGVRAVAELPTVKALLPFLNPDRSTVAGKVLAYVYSLQPAWWLLRVLPVVGIGHGGVGLVILGVPAAFVSILVGYYSRVDRRMLWLVVPANALVGSLLAYYLLGYAL